MSKHLLRALTIMTLLVGPTTVHAEGDIALGAKLAQEWCANCHAIGHYGESPLPIAPPFRTLHTRYDVEDLAESLAEGILVGHPSMPSFRFDPDQIDNLIAYLKSLEF